MAIVKSFVGRYSDIDFKYDIDRTSDTTARIQCYYRWKFVNNSTHDGIVSFFSFWTAWGLAIQPKSTDFKYCIGSKDSAVNGVTDIKRLSGFEYAGFEKKNRDRIYIGDWNGDANGTSEYIKICDVTATITKDTTSIPIYFGLIRPGSGSGSSAEDLHWFYAGTHIINNNVRVYSTPVMSSVGMTRSMATISAVWSPARNLDILLSKEDVVTYKSYYVFNGVTTVLPDVTIPHTSFTMPERMKTGGTLTLYVKAVDANGVESNTVSTSITKVYERPIIADVNVKYTKTGLIVANWTDATFDEFATLKTYHAYYVFDGINYALPDTTEKQISFNMPEKMRKSGTLTFFVRAEDSYGLYSEYISESVTKTYIRPAEIIPNISYDNRTAIINVSWSEPPIDTFATVSTYMCTIGPNVHSGNILSAEHQIIAEVGTIIPISVWCIDSFGTESPIARASIKITGATSSIFTNGEWKNGELHYYINDNWVPAHSLWVYSGGEWV